ncbi:MAG: tandem-95 repeat protein [Pseudomonadota bacterium]|nr:tandem-95 repeat protein [Pseudomonadota bacterium]
MEINKLSKVLMLSAAALTLLSCNKETFLEIKSEQNDYFSSNGNSSFQRKSTTMEDIRFLGQARIYADPENRITYAITRQPALGKINSFNEMTAQFEYVPVANISGLDSFEIVATVDRKFTSEPHKIEVEILPVNDLPTAFPAALATSEDAPKSGKLVGSDIDSAALIFSVAKSPDKGTVTINPSSGDYVYSPRKDVNGTDSFSFKVSDGQLTSNDAFISLTIAPINDLPVAASGNLNTDQDVRINGQLSVVDVDADALEYSIVVMPLKGTINNLNVNTGTYTFVPNAGAIGTDSFTFRARDRGDFSNTATTTVNLNNVNDAPVAQNISTTTNEDGSVDIKMLATDADGDPLNYRLTKQPVNGTAGNRDLIKGTFTYFPNANFNGSDSIQFVASDGTVDSAIKTISIIVTAVNDVPVAQNISATTNEDSSVTIKMLATDVDGDSLAYRLTGQPVNGTVGSSDMVAGTFVYTPKANFYGPDSVQYAVSDGKVDSVVKTVAITVNAVNDAPVSQNIDLVVDKNTNSGVPLVASDVDGDSLTYRLINIPANGYVTTYNDGGVLVFDTSSPPL